MEILIHSPLLFAAAGYSLLYLLCGGGLVGAIVIFYKSHPEVARPANFKLVCYQYVTSASTSAISRWDAYSSSRRRSADRVRQTTDRLPSLSNVLFKSTLSSPARRRMPPLRRLFAPARCAVCATSFAKITVPQVANSSLRVTLGPGHVLTARALHLKNSGSETKLLLGPGYVLGSRSTPQFDDDTHPAKGNEQSQGRRLGNRFDIGVA
jgi:hypothetical protein